MVITFILKSPLLRYPFPTYIPFLVSMKLSETNTNLKPFLLNNDPDTRFFQIFGTCNTSLRVSSLPDVIFNTTFPWPSTLEEEELPIKSCSPLSMI